MSLLNERAPTTVFQATTLESERRVAMIERGVPMPNKRAYGRPNPGEGALTFYPWEEMDVGDSFAADLKHNDNALRGAAWMVGCRLGRDYSTRLTEGGHYRVWRTK